MSRFGLFMGMLALVLATGTGCGLRRAFVPCCGGGCGVGGNCGESCGVANDPILGDCNKCGVCGGSNCPGFTPCGYLKYMLTCSGGCSGQMYYGEWISDPPACCDPCDNCGNWTGPACCARRQPIQTLREMWFGNRYCGSCCGDSCGGGGCSSHGPMVGGAAMSGGPIETAPRNLRTDENGNMLEEVPAAAPRIPTPAQSPRRAAPEPKASRPTNTRGVSYTRPSGPVRPGSYRGEYPQQGYSNPPQGYSPREYPPPR